MLTSGTKLGTYEITSHIGSGGMGEVYQAHDSKLGRDVAIKVLPEQFARDPERLARFQREAKMLASLNHPNIAAIYGLEQSGDTHYLVMELVPGETLREKVAGGRAVPVEEALTIAKQIAEALEAAHNSEKCIIHRDLKPANVKVTPEGRVKVLDFGLAKAFTAEPSATDIGNSPTLSMAATVQGVIMGTAAYMSPEQAKGKHVDKRTDIWAFGVVLYELLTGKQAFPGADISEILAAVIKSEPDWQALPAATPAKVRDLLRHCLQKDKTLRLRDAGDAQIAIQEAIAAPKDSGAAQAAPASTSKLPWLIAAVALAAAGAVGLLYLRQPGVTKPGVIRFEVPAPVESFAAAQIWVSPDGSRIAFSAISGGDARTRLWVRDLDSLEARPLAGTEGTSGGLFWLPDSRTLVFRSGEKLRKIDVTGGPAQSICDFRNELGGGFLTADNQIVFGTSATSGIQECPAGGGPAKSLTTFQPGGQEQYHAFPSLLPDGRHFLFWRAAGPQSGIYVGALDAKPEEQTGKRVLPDSSAPIYVAGPGGGSGEILFVRENTLMAQGFDAGKLELIGEAVPVGENLRNPYSFSASQDGKLVYLTAPASDVQLTWFDRQGKTLGTLGKTGPAFANMRISPDASMLAANRNALESKPDIWVVNLAQGSETRLTTDETDTSPVWSPDGKRIVFASNREGTTNLYSRAADGAGIDELLLRTGERKRPLDWSKDGKFLLFNVLTAKGWDVWALPMDAGGSGEQKAMPYLHSDANKTTARFSPDTRFVAYLSDESGAVELYVRPFDPASPEASGTGSGKVKVSQNGGGPPLWASNGKQMLYVTPDHKLWSVDVTLSPQFHAGAPKLLGEMPRGDFAATPDLQRFLIGTPVGAEQPSAKVVLNWQAGLKK